jgi:F-type H+-transporting ATPase subunit epsilon
MASLKLQVVTPERKIVDVECDEAELPGELGYLGILPGHTPIIALLKIGVISYKTGKGEARIASGAGFMEVSNDVVTALCDFAELPSEIDVPGAGKAKSAAEEEMKSVGPETFDEVSSRVAKAEAELAVAGRA